MNWKMKTPTSPYQKARISMEILTFSYTKKPWNHRKGYKCSTQRATTAIRPHEWLWYYNRRLESAFKKVQFERKHTESSYINLRKVILLEIQSTMDLLYNEEIKEMFYKTKKKMRLCSNG